MLVEMGAEARTLHRGRWLVPEIMLVEMGPETVTGMEEKETEATVVEMAEAVRPERAPCCGMIWGMRRR